MATTRKNRKDSSKKSTKRVSRTHLWAHKRPWRVTYRNKDGEKVVNILKNGAKKNSLLKKIEKNNYYIYGINNLTDNQIEFYKRNGELK